MQPKSSHPGFHLTIAAALCLGLLALTDPAQSQQSDETTTFDDVQKEFSEAFESIGQFTASERDEALADLHETLRRLDDRIAETEAQIRDEWSEMSQATREKTADTMRTLRERRNRLSEAVGALSQGVDTAWGGLMAGVRTGWSDLEQAWDEAAAAVRPEEKTGD